MPLLKTQKIYINEMIVGGFSNPVNPEKETKIDFSEIGNTVSQGIKNAGAGLSNLISKKNKTSSEEDNLDKIKKLCRNVR